MRKLFITLVALFAIFLSGIAALHAEDFEESAVAGGYLVVHVTDSVTMQPVQEALVLIKSDTDRYYSLTDNSGTVTFGPIPQDYYRIIAGKKGYKWKSYYANVYDGYTNTIYLPLAEK
jgi:hypothetical protein